jgi:hypothetical protein
MKTIIITGCPRTGTTALTSLLYHSSNALVTNELATFHPNKQELLKNLNKPLNEDNTRALELKGWSKEQLQDFIDHKFKDSRIELFGDKRPDYCCNHYNMHYLIKTYPDAFFIFTHRDPCATVYSFLKRSQDEPQKSADWYAETAEEAINKIIKWNTNWSTLFYPKVKNKIIINYDIYINQPLHLINILEQFTQTKLDIHQPENLYCHPNPDDFKNKLTKKEQNIIYTKYMPLINHIQSLCTI